MSEEQSKSKAEKLFDRLYKSTAKTPELSVDDVELLLSHPAIKKDVQPRKQGSHTYIVKISDPVISMFWGVEQFSVVESGGQRVKPVYVRDILKYIGMLTHPEDFEKP